MKISTSLIRIRYAVGVMLALSAVFAVVIGTSTLQPRDATAQDPPPVAVTISVNVDEDMLREGDDSNKTADVTVMLNQTVTTSVNVTLELGTGDDAATRGAVNTIADDYAVDEETQTINNDSDLIVTIPQGSTSGSVRVTINDGDDAETEPDEGTETITLSLSATVPTQPDYTFTNHDDDDSVEIMVYDEENSVPVGTVTIDDTTPAVGDELTATAAFTADDDRKTSFENGPDGQSGTTTDNNSPVLYQWGRIVLGDNPATPDVTEPDFEIFEAISGATGMKYMVMASDAGKVLAVRAGFEDDAGFGMDAKPMGNYIQSANTDEVLNSINLSVSQTQVTEGSDSSVIVTVTLSAAPAAGTPADIAWTASIDSADATDYTIPAGTELTITNPYTTGTFQVNITDDELPEANETITIELGTAPTGYANGDSDSVTITIVDDENQQATGMPVIKVGSNPAPMYVAPDTTLTADISGISDPDGVTEAAGPDGKFGTNDDVDGEITYTWGTLDEGGMFVSDGASGSPTDEANYEVDADDGGKTLAVRVSFGDDADPDATPARPRVTETLTSEGVKAAVLVNFDKSMYTVVETSAEDEDAVHTADVTVSLSNAPADDETVEVVVTATGNMAGTFSMGDDEITLPHTLQFTGVDPNTAMETMQVITYTAPDDVSGRQMVTLGFGAISEDDHMAGAMSSATIVIRDEDDTQPVGYSLTIAPETPSVGDTVTATLSGLEDPDGLSDPHEVCFVWRVGGEERLRDCVNARSQSPLSATSRYTVTSNDANEALSVSVEYTDLAGNLTVLSFTGPATTVSDPADVPSGTAMISRIEETIRGITVSAGDRVRLSVDVYGLQNVKDSKLAEKVTFDWSVDPVRGTLPEDKEGNSTVMFTAPSSPGTYTVTAKLGASDCYDADAKVGEKTAGCDAKFEVRVRRQAAPQPEDPAPVNPPGDIPELIPDADGNQYEVFTPVEGGTFDGGEGYSIKAAPGAVPNGEFIGVRMSDDGAASNVGQTHQRYTLAGNMYGVHAVDASGAAISSYVLEDPATVCVPLPASVRANLSTLSLAAINSDGSLTILAAQAKLNTAGDTMVCGNLSSLPSSVAVGTRGAPDAIPTATPVPDPVEVLPDTGGASPASGGLVWVLLLGTAAVVSGTFIVAGRRRKMVRSK